MHFLDLWRAKLDEGWDLATLWDALRERYGYESARVFLLQGGSSSLAYASGGDIEATELILAGRSPYEGVVGAAIRRGEPLEVLDYARHPQALPERVGYVRSLVVLPLRHAGEDLGALVLLNHREPHAPLTPEQLEELRVFQELLSVHMAYLRARRKNERQRGLIAFMDRIHRINDLDELVPALFQGLARDIAHNAVAVGIVEGGHFRILYGVGEGGQLPRTQGEVIVPATEGSLFRYALDHDEPLLIGDIFDPAVRQIYPVRYFDAEPGREAANMRSYLGVPFRSRSMRGVVSLQSERPWHYGVEELEHLVAVAEVLGYAVEQLRWRGLDRFARRLTQLEWRAGEEREYFAQMLQATTEVWRHAGAALYTHDASGACRFMAASGRLHGLPAELDLGNRRLERPVRFSSRGQVPDHLRPLWRDGWMKGALLVPLGNGLLWVASERGFTEWDEELARSVAREARPHTERLGLQSRLAREAELDPLTGVFNRRRLYLRLRRLIAQADRHDQPFAVAVVDMLDFGKVNNEHGHLVGDRVLARVAQVLQSSLREGDDIYRLGGDEFVLLLPRSGRREGLVAVRRAAEALEADPLLLEHGVRANFGLAAYEPGDTPESLIERADREMYAAKRRGVSVLDPPEA